MLPTSDASMVTWLHYARYYNQVVDALTSLNFLVNPSG